MHDKLFFFGALFSLVACSGNTVEVGGYAQSDAGASQATTDAATTAPNGAKIEIHLRASTASVPHADALSGQTPSDQKIGIRSLSLLTGPGAAPLVVFDHGANAVEAGLNDKDDTVVATVLASSLRAGAYTLARVGISHVRYRVAATMHTLGQSVPGTFDNLQVLSDGSLVDGATRNKGHYRFTFEVGGKVLATQPGEGGPLPEVPSGGGISMSTSGPETAYVFPINLPVDPTIATDVTMLFDINTSENFRWQDEPAAGHQPKVFDVTPTTFEPVKSFGANSFRLTADFGTSAP